MSNVIVHATFHVNKPKVTDFLKIFQTLLEFNNYKSIYADFEVETVKNSDRFELFNLGMLLAVILCMSLYNVVVHIRVECAVSDTKSKLTQDLIYDNLSNVCNIN